MKLYKLLFITIFTLSNFALLAQPDSVSSAGTNRIIAIAGGYTDSIVIRWAPSTPIVWQLGNRFGYKIERYTILRDGKINPNSKAEVKTIVSNFKPLAEAQWESLVQKNEMASVVQEILYGERENTNTDDWMSAMQSYNELSQRFGFALFVCDFNADIAQAAALRWVDKDINLSEQYVYHISLAENSSGVAVDMGTLVINPTEKFIVPQITNLIVEFGDKKAIVTWPVEAHRGSYTAYLIQRSTDGVTYENITDLPFSPMSVDDNDPTIANFTDSLPENGVKFYYRVAGLTPLATQGSFSNIVSGVGKTEFEVEAYIDTVYEQGADRVIVSWQIQNYTNTPLHGINVYRAFTYKGPYTKMNTDIISTVENSYSDNILNTNNVLYYRLEVVGEKNGQTIMSVPHSIELTDTTPPLPPIGLVGKADTNGVVSLSWTPNQERDLFGYRIFRANSLHEEFKEITSTITNIPAITDTIYLRTTTPKVYYKLLALDKRYNPSEYSEVLEIARPDTIPPVAPIIVKSGFNELGMYVEWEHGPSEDVDNYRLYLINQSENAERLLLSWSANQLCYRYIDSVSVQGVTYNFKLTATDYAGNKSETISRDLLYETGIRPAIKDIKTVINREKKTIALQWNYTNNEQVDRYLIYRSTPNNPMILYKTVLKNNKLEIEDNAIQPSNIYTYKIKALFVNGAESELSKAVEVKF